MPPLPYGNAGGRWLIRNLSRFGGRTGFEGGTLELIRVGSLNLRVYRPDHYACGAALVWIHGGGYVVGAPAQDHARCTAVCRELGIVVVSVGYRLAPGHPYPAALDDCMSAWQWLLAAAQRLGVDPGGQSAGGGLAAALVQRLCDTAGPVPKAQWLFCPMLDDRTAARRELDGIKHPIWNNRQNAIGWQSANSVGSIYCWHIRKRRRLLRPFTTVLEVNWRRVVTV
ncbi:alpha/beta hydrolase [Burkholderia cenocepacia]|nr:alpha/beta hydrolase [Burkholderia cenocepacia]